MGAWLSSVAVTLKGFPLHILFALKEKGKSSRCLRAGEASVCAHVCRACGEAQAMGAATAAAFTRTLAFARQNPGLGNRRFSCQFP